jgi:hypothetical protein
MCLNKSPDPQKTLILNVLITNIRIMRGFRKIMWIYTILKYEGVVICRYADTNIHTLVNWEI